MDGLKSTGGSITNYLRTVLGTYTPSGDSFGGADWEYIVSAILLILCVYFIFRMFVLVFKR